MALVLFGMNLVIHARFRPYATEMLNTCETLVLTALCVTQVCSLFTLLDFLFENRENAWVDWFVLLGNTLVVIILVICAVQAKKRSKKQRSRDMTPWFATKLNLWREGGRELRARGARPAQADVELQTTSPGEDEVRDRRDGSRIEMLKHGQMTQI